MMFRTAKPARVAAPADRGSDWQVVHVQPTV